MSEPRDVLRTARARAPLRLGLAGGGTDLPAYAEKFEGFVVNATIDRYAFASISARDDGYVVFRACDLGKEENHRAAPVLADAQLSLHRGVYERMVREFNGGAPLSVSVTTWVDVPLGSGLGASSALTVALIEAYAGFLNVYIAPAATARLACAIERTDLGLAGGLQDQYAAALGGLNALSFLAGARVQVERLPLNPAILNELESSLVICFSGRSRLSDRIIREQNQRLTDGSEAALAAMHALKELAGEVRRALLGGNIEEFATALEASWIAKKCAATLVGSAEAEALEAIGRRNGAISAKVSGAGGGGFMMFVVPAEQRWHLIEALNAAGNPGNPVKLTSQGAESWIVPAHA